jgi:hypothetical protein
MESKEQREEIAYQELSNLIENARQSSVEMQAMLVGDETKGMPFDHYKRKKQLMIETMNNYVQKFGKQKLDQRLIKTYLYVLKMYAEIKTLMRPDDNIESDN